MTASLQRQLRAAVAVAVAGIGADDVHQNRDLQLASGKNSQVHVNLRRSTPLLPEDQVIYTGHPRDWETEIELQILTRRVGGAEATDCADALWVAAYAALMADQTLGGRVWDMHPGEATFEDAEGDTSLCRLTWTVALRHRTSNDSLIS